MRRIVITLVIAAGLFAAAVAPAAPTVADSGCWVCNSAG